MSETQSGTWQLVDRSNGNVRECDSRSEAEDKKQDMAGLGARLEDLAIVPPGEEIELDRGDDNTEVDVVDHSEPTDTPQEDTGSAETETMSYSEGPADAPVSVPSEKPSLDKDPVDWLPSHFIDEIQGVPTLNRKGYAVMAERFGVSVTSDPVVRASETDFEFAEFQATAKTEDGTEYSGFGSAHIARMDGDDAYLLNELAETRAMKRACAWALGLGMTATEELQSDL